MTLTHDPEFRVALAHSADDLRAAQGLRYEVFVEELGGDGPLVDHAARLEIDQFDPFFDHLILFDDVPDATKCAGRRRRCVLLRS
jgi:putative hemolysin